MGHISQALKSVSPYFSQHVPVFKDALRYIETGDPAALARIKPGSGKGSNWTHHVVQAVGRHAGWSDEDRRALHVLAAVHDDEGIGRALDTALEKEKVGGDVHDLFRAELSGQRVRESRIVRLTIGRVTHYSKGRQPNSAGRFLLGLSDESVVQAVQEAVAEAAKLEKSRETWGVDRALEPLVKLVEFWLAFAAERGPCVVDVVLSPQLGPDALEAVCRTVLQKGGDRYVLQVVRTFRAAENPSAKFRAGAELMAAGAEIDRREILTAARGSVAQGLKKDTLFIDVMIWMIEQFGVAVRDDVLRFIPTSRHSGESLLPAAVKTMGQEAVPIIVAAIHEGGEYQKLKALPHLIALGEGPDLDLARSEIRRGLAEEYSSYALHELSQWINLAARWDPAAFAEPLWKLLGHKDRGVREAVVQALGKLAEDAVPRASALLGERDAKKRALGVAVLAVTGSPRALEALEARLDAETNEEVRDAILLGLEASWARAGRQVTREEMAARVSRAAPKIKAPLASWLKEAKLPPLLDTAGQPFDAETVRYLLYRQSRAKEIKPDVEARPLLRWIDRRTSGDFALAVLKAYLDADAPAEDRWALTIAGMLGDDRVVAPLYAQIQRWVEGSRRKMAEFAIQVLALLGSDAALLLIDALAVRYRTKFKGLAEIAAEAFAAAAHARGLTTDELGDRVVPWLGFEPGRPCVLEFSGNRVEVSVGLDFKPKYQDLAKNKRLASLPKLAPKEVLDQGKELVAALREVSKAQVVRMEGLMVRQYRWPVDRWRELFLGHPLLFPFAVRLVWGTDDNAGVIAGTFHALEDRTLTDVADKPFTLPDSGSVGIVHPLELDDDQRPAWRTHLADYEITPPFPQLERPVVRVEPDQHEIRIVDDFKGTTLNGLTFKGRAERLGWKQRVGESGSVPFFWKSFPAAGVGALLAVEDMGVGVEPDREVTLGEALFARDERMQGFLDAYDYERPGDDDAGVVALGHVPPIVFSEVMGDLRRIAGQGAEGSE
jgi:hypothetical protein